MQTILRLAVPAMCCVLPASLVAQGVDPIGRVHPGAQRLAEVAVVVMPAFDRVALAQQDAIASAQKLPPRFAVPNVVNITPETDGTWEQLDGAWSLWRLRLQSPDANHVNLGFTTFQLPDGARLMVYSSDYRSIVRPFDSTDHSPSGELWTPVVFGSEITVEVYVQTTLRPKVELVLSFVNSGYRLFGAGPSALGTDGSASCNIDVACPQAAAWAAEIHSVAKITIGGSTLCSGFMVNNTAQDRKNYFVTADHCGAASAPATVVAYWNYENTVCGAPDDASSSQFNTGASLRATHGTSDFTLLEFNSAPNPAWGVTYAGWNRTTASTVSTSATGIHHPSGDTKKISIENQSTTTTSNGGFASPGDGSHVRVADWDAGVTEGGSSGSPLFDQNHRAIGQLHSGGSACGNNASDWYGKLGVSWTGGGTNATRLSNWLDPVATGATTLDTLVPPYALALSYGAGCYRDNAAFYELFCGPDFDLSGSGGLTIAKSFAPITNGYQITPGPNQWFTPLSADLGLGDEASVAQVLPWTFAYPGGTTNTVRMYSNGYVFLSGAGTVSDFTPTAAELTSGAARFAPLWIDLAPNLAGSTHYDVDPSGTAVYFTWNAVRAFGTGPGAGTDTFQLVLRQNGTVEYRYRLVANTPADCVVGWSRGAAQVPRPTDVSSAIAFEVSVDAAPLTFTPVNRPLQGTTQNFLIANIPDPANAIGLVLAGFRTAPLDLTFLGAPECFLHDDAILMFAFLPIGSVHVWTASISSDPADLGLKIAVQAAMLVPGVNPFGAVTSNAVELTYGTL